jgi:hypothetical protein
MKLKQLQLDLLEELLDWLTEEKDLTELEDAAIVGISTVENDS